MSFRAGSGYFTGCINKAKVTEILSSNTLPVMSLWEKVKEFFCSTHEAEVRECLYHLCHPPAKTTSISVQALFERLKKLAHPEYNGNIQCNQPEYFYIMDKDGN